MLDPAHGIPKGGCAEVPCKRLVAQGAGLIKCLHALQEYLQSQDLDVNAITAVSLAQAQPWGVTASASAAAAPGGATSAAVAAPAPAPPPGVDMATVGKGVGVL